MEESKQIPEEKNSIESSSEIKKESNKEENVKAFTEFLEKASNQDIDEEKTNSDLKEKVPEIKDNSIFKIKFRSNYHNFFLKPKNVKFKFQTDTAKVLHYSCISQESFTYISNNKK